MNLHIIAINHSRLAVQRQAFKPAAFVYKHVCIAPIVKHVDALKHAIAGQFPPKIAEVQKPFRRLDSLAWEFRAAGGYPAVNEKILKGYERSHGLPASQSATRRAMSP